MAGSRKNAFTYFVEEYMNGEISRGRKITKKVALEECTVGWSELEPEKRLRYCNMANPMLNRVTKSGEKAPTPPNMEWLDPVTGEYGEKWLRYVRSGDELYYLKDAVKGETNLRRFSFYLVHFNYFCKPSLKKYVPAELALLEFNLGEGIKNVYHTLINPGSIPLGFAHEAKRLSQEGHGIPVPPQSKGERDMAKVIEAVKKFLKYGTGPTGKYPPLFTVVDNVLPAMHMLNDMVPYNEDQPVFTVYPTHRMFYWIKNKCSEICGKGAGFLDESYALKEIERDCFRYIVEIACDFHKQYDSKFPMCSQSIVKRLAFTICDHCCRDLNITLVGGKHVHKSFRDSSPDQKAEEKRKKGKKENDEEEELEDYYETDEETGLERSLAEQCNCGEIPEFVCGYSTREFPKDDLSNLTHDEVQLFYNAFMHNLMDGKVKFDEYDEEEEMKDYVYLKNSEMFDNPFSSPQESEGEEDFPTVTEELQVYRQSRNRKIRSMIVARITARAARDSRESCEDGAVELVTPRTNRRDSNGADEPDK